MAATGPAASPQPSAAPDQVVVDGARGQQGGDGRLVGLHLVQPVREQDHLAAVAHLQQAGAVPSGRAQAAGACCRRGADMHARAAQHGRPGAAVHLQGWANLGLTTGWVLHTAHWCVSS